MRNEEECVCSAPNCWDTEQRSASQPGSVASGTPCIIAITNYTYPKTLLREIATCFGLSSGHRQVVGLQLHETNCEAPFAHFIFTVFLRRCGPTRVMASSFTRFLDYTQRHTTVGRTPLDEWSARHRNHYLTIQHSQQTNIHAPGGIRTHNLSRRAAADPRLRPRGLWDWQSLSIM